MRLEREVRIVCAENRRRHRQERVRQDRRIYIGV